MIVNYLYFVYVGFLEKEIKKDGILMLDIGDNSDVLVFREMIDLEVCVFVFYVVNKRFWMGFFYFFIKYLRYIRFVCYIV